MFLAAWWPPKPFQEFKEPPLTPPHPLPFLILMLFLGGARTGASKTSQTSALNSEWALFDASFLWLLYTVLALQQHRSRHCLWLRTFNCRGSGRWFLHLKSVSSLTSHLKDPHHQLLHVAVWTNPTENSQILTSRCFAVDCSFTFFDIFSTAQTRGVHLQ